MILTYGLPDDAPLKVVRKEGVILLVWAHKSEIMVSVEMIEPSGLYNHEHSEAGTFHLRLVVR